MMAFSSRKSLKPRVASLPAAPAARKKSSPSPLGKFAYFDIVDFYLAVRVAFKTTERSRPKLEKRFALFVKHLLREPRKGKARSDDFQVTRLGSSSAPDYWKRGGIEILKADGLKRYQVENLRAEVQRVEGQGKKSQK